VTAAPATGKGRRTRQVMIEHAARLMQERGIAATSVEDVLNASGTGKSQMYHYFGGKQGLTVAVLTFQFERVMSGEPSLRDPACDDLDRWRDEVLRAHRASTGGTCPLGVFSGQVGDPELREVLAGLFDRWREAIAGLVRRARDAGRVPESTDPTGASLALLSAVQGGTLLAYLSGDDTPLAEALDRALAAVSGR
jgi:TetR/AcrR family transcriptional repressor of nem operon